MQKLNKRAMAESVATFALIVVAVVAVGFAGYSLMKLFALSDIQASPVYSCLELTSGITNKIELTETCLNSDGEIEVAVRRNNEDFLVSSLSFALEDESWTCSESCGDCDVLEAGTSRTYYLTSDQNPLDKTLTFYVGSCEIGERRIISC